MRMRSGSLLLIVLVVVTCAAQEVNPSAASAPRTASNSAPSDFRVRYVNGSNVYIDAGRNAGLEVGVELVLKQDTSAPAQDASNAALEPGIVAKLKIVAVASTSAVCEVVATTRDLAAGDMVSLPSNEVEKLIEKNTLGSTRKYPIVISFSDGDPLDEEVREQLPRPPLPEVNQLRGRLGFDMSTIRQLGQGVSSTSNAYGFVFRADFTRILGTHWNLNGYWRGTLRTNSGPSQASIQDLMNRTYLMGLTYLNPDAHWTAGIGRIYLPWASSLETIDGAYAAGLFGKHGVAGIFAGSTPDPTAWDYNPQRRIGGAFFNAHGGSFEHFRYSTTGGFGIELLKWNINRPFVFTENNFSYQRYFSLYQSMQIDRPAANPSMSPVPAGVGKSLVSLRVQVHPRVIVDLTDTYFRDVPTYDASLVGTGLLDKYLYQGINGGARIQFPRHITGYFSLGRSSDSSDPKQSLNELFGGTMSSIWKTGLTADARYSKFDSAFASGTYSTVTVSRDMLDHLRLDLQVGRYVYTSTLAANSGSKFANLMFDSNLGARMFVQSMFTVQRGGSLNYNQWTTTVGVRFNNRSSRRAGNARP